MSAARIVQQEYEMMCEAFKMARNVMRETRDPAQYLDEAHAVESVALIAVRFYDGMFTGSSFMLNATPHDQQRAADAVQQMIEEAKRFNDATEKKRVDQEGEGE